MSIRSLLGTLAAASVLTLVGYLATTEGAERDTQPARDATVHELMARDLVGVDTKEVRMLTVEYAGGGASLPHRHDAQVFVYVLEGSVRMQVEGSPEVVLHRGDTFYEAPGDVHTVSANANQREPARFLVFIVKTKGAPVTSR